MAFSAEGLVALVLIGTEEEQNREKGHTCCLGLIPFEEECNNMDYKAQNKR